MLGRDGVNQQSAMTPPPPPGDPHNNVGNHLRPRSDIDRMRGGVGPPLISPLHLGSEERKQIHVHKMGPALGFECCCLSPLVSLIRTHNHQPLSRAALVGMSGPSAFLSFPDFSKATSSKELAAGADPSSAPVSSFSSFPDIEFDKPAAGKRDDKTHDRKYRSAEEDDRGEGSSKRRRREGDESDRRKHRRDREERNSRSSRREHDAHESSRSSRRHREGDNSLWKKEEVDRRRDTSGRPRQEEDKGKERMRDRSREREREKRSRDHDHNRDRDRERGMDRERLDKRSRLDKDDERDRDERRLEKEQRRAREREQVKALRGDTQDDGRAWYETTAAAAKATTPVSYRLSVDELV